MQFSLSDEQTLLRDSAAAFVRDHSSLRRIRALRDGKDADGFSRDLWKQIAALGWLGIPFAEDDGGLGLGLKELALVLEEFGKGLMPEPVLSSVLLGGTAIQRGGSAAQRAALLPALIGGELLLALACQERHSRYDLSAVATRAERAGDGWRLRGEKCLVLDGHVADRLIVSARTAGGERDRDGITLFLVERGARGVTVTRQWTLDGRNAALVRFDGIAVGPADVVGAVDGGGTLLAEVIDRATAGLCAEMLGGMEAAFAMTLDYLKTRRQFGVPIGSFQALKHRAAVLFTEIELARSAVLAAAMALDAGEPQAAQIVSAAKARCSDTFILAGNEGVQMHGGIGMTDEHDIGFYLKRARAAEITFGDGAFHRERFAALRGY
ncbi:MAG TPA: acyl-CoA dehydrogenase [Candidatus Dormibacteraeota bacterium]|nr:acyl-CoA dehydrogenase [Candidatus Dormibacteraeota bacterium]